MYSNVVLDVDHHNFEDLLDNYKLTKGVLSDTDLKAEDWKTIVGNYKDIVKKNTKKDFPQDSHEQLWGAISAVFKSWQNQRAKTYRRLNNIPEEWGTAVNIQSMVLVIWVMIAQQELRLPEIPLRERIVFMVSI